MATVRVFEFTPKLKAGLILPTGAGATKLWTSDAEGKGSWEAREKIKFIIEHTWAAEGLVGTGTTPGFFIKVGTGVEKKLLAVEFKLETEGELEFEVFRSAKGGTGAVIGTGYEKLKAKSTEVKRATETIALATEDFIYLKKVAATSNPKNFSCTAFMEVVIS